MVRLSIAKGKEDWAKELCVKNLGDFSCGFKKTKMEEIDLFSVSSVLGLIRLLSIFIVIRVLEDVIPLGGSAFTWCHKSATKMSKLDRFFVSNNLLNIFPHISGITLDRFLSDHRPILLREWHDYGPCSFRVSFNIGFISRALMISSLQLGILPLLLTLMECVTWRKELNQLDAVIDKGTGTEVEAEKRMEVLAALRNIDHIHPGLGYLRLMGVWKEQPNDVKQEFLSHFQDRFAKPSERRANIDMRFPKTISEDQSQDLEREVSKQEIKTAVWGCGTDKSPGPDGCLTSSKGSILVNGCPTNEFQFYKGLKQGDPLSPFLFILVMESLHLSFQRIVNAGGVECNGNISTLIHVLKCFFHASGLKINLNKSKIMGINVESAQVIQAAAKLGCLVLKCPFYYLGTRVGGSMTRVQAWQRC
ncbi:RNA-directed DNA polymerase, eukaryota [Tanacetum coccineum]